MGISEEEITMKLVVDPIDREAALAGLIEKVLREGREIC